MSQQHFKICVGAVLAGQRLDKILTESLADYSRSRLQSLIKDGQVLVNDEVCRKNAIKLKEEDHIVVNVPAPVAADPEPENIPLDIVYEDDDLLVINKAVGMVVHPGAGNHNGTLVNALLYHCRDRLSGIGGVLRPGIVHRLDKDTSGLMLVAKNDQTHASLSGQLQDRTLGRLYQALVFGAPMPIKGHIDQPVGRHSRNRLKRAIALKGGKNAKTFYKVLEGYRGVCSLVECKLETGRTHQIRVHMEFLKYPLIGDRLYGPQVNAVESALKRVGYEEEDVQSVLAFSHQALHAGEIHFYHHRLEEMMRFKVEVPVPFRVVLDLLSS